MDVAMLQYPPGDPRMIDTIVHQLKSQGIFDQFRKECIADVDTKPAYQNLHQRVEGTVSGFLAHQVWRPDLNKNQVRESLRKHILESGYLDLGVERIVDQVVNPKIMTVLVPQVEDVVYKFIGIEKPKKAPVNHTSIAPRDLLPKDLDPVSPESDVGKKSPTNSIEDGEFDERDKVGGTPPPFNALETSNDNSMGSHLSGISGLTSPDGHLSNISYIGGKTPPRKSFEGDSNHSRISMESVRSLSAMEVEHSDAYNIMELDAPTTYERMEFEKPSRLEQPVPDKPSSFEREEAERASAEKARFEQAEAEKAEKQRIYERAAAEKQRIYERSEAEKQRIYERSEAEKQRIYERSEAEKQRIYERAEAERRMSYEGLEAARRGSCSESETEFETSSDEESSPEHEPLDGSMSPINALHIDLDRADVNKVDSTATPANEAALPTTAAEPKVAATGDGKPALKDVDVVMASPKEKCDSAAKELKVKDEPKAKPKEVEEKHKDKPTKKVEKDDLKTSRKESDKSDKEVKKPSVKDGSVKKEEKKKESEGHSRKSDKDKDPKKHDNSKKSDKQSKSDTKKEEKPAKKSEKGEKDDVKKEDKSVKKDEKSKKDDKGGRKEERRSSHSSHRSSHHSKPRKSEEEGKKKEDDGKKKEDVKHKGDDGRKKEEVKHKVDDGRKKEEVKKRDDDGKKKEDVKKRDDDGKRKEDDARKRKDSHSSKNGKSDKSASSKDKETKEAPVHRREKDGSKSEAGKERKDQVKDKSKAISTKEKDGSAKDKDPTTKDKDPSQKDASSLKEKERREKERKAREAGKRKKAVDDHRGHRDRRSEDRRSADGDSNGTARERPRESSQSSRPMGSKEGRTSEHGGQSGSSGGNSEQGEANQKAAKGSEKEKHRRSSSSHGSHKRSPDAKLKTTVRAPPLEAPPSPEVRYFSDVDDSDLRGFSAFVARLTAEYERDLVLSPKRGRPAIAGKAKAVEGKPKAKKLKTNTVTAKRLPGGLTKELVVKVEQLVYKVEPKKEQILSGKEPVATREKLSVEPAVDDVKPVIEEKPLSTDKERVSGDVSNATCTLVSAESESDRLSIKCEPTEGSEDVSSVSHDEIFVDRPTVVKPEKANHAHVKDHDIFKEHDIVSQLSKEHEILYGEPSEDGGSEPVEAEKPVSPVDRDDEVPCGAKRARSSLDGAVVLAEKQYESRDFTVESGATKTVDASCVGTPKTKVYEARDLTAPARPSSSASDGPRSRPQSRAESRFSEDMPRSRPSSSLEVRSSIETECTKGTEGAEMRPPPAASSPGTGRRSRQPSTRYSASDYSLVEPDAEGEEPVRTKVAVGRKRSWPRDVEATDNNNERLGAGDGDKAIEAPTGVQDEATESKKPKVGRPRGRPPGSKKAKEPITETKLAVTDGRVKGREATPTFVMPLSPESDVSASSAELANRKAPSVSPTPAPAATNKRATPAAASRAQRYSSDDLYKPRPLFSRGRRARGPQIEDGQ